MNIYDYLNPSHGLELFPGNTKGWRGNENGILFYCQLLHLLNERKELTFTHINFFIKVVDALEVKRGLYNRGAGEMSIPFEERRTISHDNISGISAGSFLLKTRHAKDIYRYGKRNLFIYNNVKPRKVAPMNPGNWSIWAYCGGSKVLWLLFLPFFVINMLISCTKPKEITSSKLLYFTELYPVKNSNLIWKALWAKYSFLMRKQYGKEWLHKMMVIYYKDENHPNRVLSKGLVL
jgi:hypothetical protein